MNCINELTASIHNGVTLPTLGYRVIKGHGDVYSNVMTALRAGYRHFDISSDHTVEKDFGRALSDSNIHRNELFITVKISNDDHGFMTAFRAFQNSLSRLKIDYADLLLIEWPNPVKFRNRYEEVADETWKALEKAYKDGLAHAIGVANYEARHIEKVLNCSEISPMVNQARIYPGFPFTDNLDCANEHKILTEGFLPDDYDSILNSKEIRIFAEKYHVTPEQVCIRYLFEKGCIALTVGNDEQKLKDNFHAYNFSLAPEDMKYLDVMKNYGPANINPDEADF